MDTHSSTNKVRTGACESVGPSFHSSTAGSYKQTLEKPLHLCVSGHSPPKTDANSASLLGESLRFQIRFLWRKQKRTLFLIQKGEVKFYLTFLKEEPGIGLSVFFPVGSQSRKEGASLNE
ncbi:uncharacterized protein LOC107970072 isoform X2 [Pan troglodytes]|uniref:uncharacterized protein LOC107970072 isoform X2 n=1 Tax=Pan troglodytes TaxID=9598 RepID=UPI00301413A8